MSHLSEHVRQAQETLDAARTSLEAARRRHAEASDDATASVLRDAEVAYEHAHTEYQNALGAQAAGGGTTGGTADHERR